MGGPDIPIPSRWVPLVRGLAGLASRCAIAAALAVFSLVGTSTAAHAACSTPLDPQLSFRVADTVFVARVVALDDFSRLATVEVLEIWKGRDLETQVVVNGSLSTSTSVSVDDRTFVMGSTYVFVPAGRRSPFVDGACSATALHNPTGGLTPAQYHDAVGASTARLPTPVAVAADTVDKGGLSPVLIGGVILSGAVLAVAIGSRRKKRKKQRAGTVGQAPSVPIVPIDRSAATAPVASKTMDIGGEVKATSIRKSKPKRAPRRASARRGIRTAAFSLERSKSSRFSRSGLSNLETMRKKTRRIKSKKTDTSK